MHAAVQVSLELVTSCLCPLSTCNHSFHNQATITCLSDFSSAVLFCSGISLQRVSWEKWSKSVNLSESPFSHYETRVALAPWHFVGEDVVRTGLMWPRLACTYLRVALNSWSSGLYHPGADIIDMCHKVHMASWILHENKKKKGKTSNEKLQNVCRIVGFTRLQMFLCETQLPSMSTSSVRMKGSQTPHLR